MFRVSTQLVFGSVCMLLMICGYLIYFQPTQDAVVILPDIPSTIVALPPQTSLNNQQDFITQKPKTYYYRPEVRHLAFLKVHKAASSTLQNIIYRFGLNRNLSFVLPEDLHYISKFKQTINTLLPPLPFYVTETSEKRENTLGKYEVLCNHAIFNKETFSKLLFSDTVYIAIVRDPLTLFLSSAYYYRYVWPNDYLAKMDENFIIDLIREPSVYEPQNVSFSRTFNTMSKDFGFEFKSVATADDITNEEFQAFVTEMGSIFDFVLLVEKFDESLIMLKRRLHWSFADIAYLKRNSLESTANSSLQITMPTLSQDDMESFRHRNRFDYMLYDYFVKQFNDAVKLEKRFDEETAAFKSTHQTVQQFCNNQGGTNTLTIPFSEWNTDFTISTDDCKLMLLDEIPFWQIMKNRHKKMFKEGIANNLI